ncbi:MAG: hypothetical protein AAGC47_12395 [Bacteroidota bacterium]
MLRYLKLLAPTLCLIFLYSCNDEEDEDQSPQFLNLSGSGSYSFADYEPLQNKPVECFYHIPNNADAESPIFILIPGSGRDAEGLRDDLIQQAEAKDVSIMAIRFPPETYQGSNDYNLASIFDDGENPTTESLNDEDRWTFNIIDPIFEDFKSRLGSSRNSYDVFGHSAGAQMIHRFALFEPQAKFNRLVSSAAGWYMLPDAQIEFPYGVMTTPLENQNLESAFNREVYVMVGLLDTDPNSFNLRHTPEADAQGLNRLERAQYYFSESRAIAKSLGHEYNWNYNSASNIGHDGDQMASFAMSILYD